MKRFFAITIGCMRPFVPRTNETETTTVHPFSDVTTNETKGGRWVRRPGNTSVRELMSDNRFTEAVLGFLRNTKVGKVKEGVVFESGLR